MPSWVHVALEGFFNSISSNKRRQVMTKIQYYLGYCQLK
jgi:hypothetical protein